MLQSFTDSYKPAQTMGVQSYFNTQKTGGLQKMDGPGSFSDYLKMVNEEKRDFFAESAASSKSAEKAERASRDESAEKAENGKDKEAAEEARSCSEIEGDKRAKTKDGAKEVHTDKIDEPSKRVRKEDNGDSKSETEKDDNTAEKERDGLKEISLKDRSKEKESSKEIGNLQDRQKVNTSKIEKPGKETQDTPNTEDKRISDEINALIGKTKKDTDEENTEKVNTEKIHTGKIDSEESKTAYTGLKEMQFISAQAAEAAEAAQKVEKSAQSTEESRGAKLKTASLQKGSEEGASKEAKAASEKGKSGNSFTIVDLRTDKESKTDKRLSAIRSGSAKGSENGEAKTAGGSQETGQVKGGKQMPLEIKEELLKSNNISKGLNSSSGDNSDSFDEKVQVLRADLSSQARGKSGAQNAQNIRYDSPLLKQLKEQLNGQIVKKSGIVLRDNGNGEIRLNLKPEHLGSVRIRLSLEDNHIAGKIYVENSSMREVFEQNMQHLQRQFEENGYESASLEVSVGDGKNHQGENRKSGSAGNGNSKAIQSLEEHIPDAVNSWHSEQLVDLMV